MRIRRSHFGKSDRGGTLSSHSAEAGKPGVVSGGRRGKHGMAGAWGGQHPMPRSRGSQAQSMQRRVCLLWYAREGFVSQVGNCSALYGVGGVVVS